MKWGKIYILNRKYRLGSNQVQACGVELSVPCYTAFKANHPSYPSISLQVIHNMGHLSFDKKNHEAHKCTK